MIRTVHSTLDVDGGDVAAFVAKIVLPHDHERAERSKRHIGSILLLRRTAEIRKSVQR
jgi:hypothetical protein